MYHYYETITNTKGDSLVGYFVRVIDTGTGNVVTLASDNGGTPIETTSGVANMCKTDDRGGSSFYVAFGSYHLDIYAPDAATFVFRLTNVDMGEATAIASSAASSAQASAATATANAAQTSADRTQTGADRTQTGADRTQVAADKASADASAALALSASGVAGAYPNAYASALPRGVTSTTSLVAGSGGTNGTFALGFSGGSITGMAGTFTVAGGALTAITITNPGLGTGTTPPTLGFTASAGLTGASATAVVAPLVATTKTYYAVSSDSAYLLLYSNDGTATPAAILSPDGTQVKVPIGTALSTAIADLAKRPPGLGGNVVMQDVGIATNTLDLREMARFNQRDNSFIAPDIMTAAQQTNKRRVFTYGHSGFEGTGVTNDQDPDAYIQQRIFIQRRTVAGKLGTRLGSDWEVFNHGISTQKIEGVGARFGALPIRVSVTGASIPATGTVTCTYCAPNPIYPNRSGMMIYGSINGFPVRLTNPSGTVLLEQPPGAAGALAVSDLSIFVPTTSGSEYAICMFWLDRNNQSVDATKHIAGQILGRMRKVGNDRCIFWGDWPLYTIVTPGQSTVGTTDYINTIAINDFYRTAFSGNFYDIYRFLREDFPYDGTLGPKASTLAGITLTTGAGDTDQTRIANGFIPKSYVDVSNSGDHFNDTGYDTLAQGAIEYFFKPRGWLA
jgi:hypothetical protein